MEINLLLAHCTALVHHALSLSTTSFYCRYTGEFICDYTNVRWLPAHDEFMALAIVLQLREADPDTHVDNHLLLANLLASRTSYTSVEAEIATLLADYEGEPKQTTQLQELWQSLHGIRAEPDFKVIHYDYTLPAWEWSLGPLKRAINDDIPNLPPRQANKPASHQIDPAARHWDKTHTRKDGTIVRSLEDTRYTINLDNPFKELATWRWNKGQPYRSGDPRPKTPLITDQTTRETT